LTECEVPDRDIGDGLRLSDLEWIDLFPDFDDGLHKLAHTLLPVLKPDECARETFRTALELHVMRKVEHFRRLGATQSEAVLAKWLELAQDEYLNGLYEEFPDLHRRARSTGRAQLSHAPGASNTGRFMLLSIVPHRNVGEFLDSLPCRSDATGNKYLAFIAQQRELFRMLPNWHARDFVHLLHFSETDETTVDVLYIEDLALRLSLVGSARRNSQSSARSAVSIPLMYPTSLLGSAEAGALWDRALRADLAQAQQEGLFRDG
jgi:hypothetical protein